jgi:hypothetical protein
MVELMNLQTAAEIKELRMVELKNLQTAAEIKEPQMMEILELQLVADLYLEAIANFTDCFRMIAIDLNLLT